MLLLKARCVDRFRNPFLKKICHKAAIDGPIPFIVSIHEFFRTATAFIFAMILSFKGPESG